MEQRRTHGARLAALVIALAGPAPALAQAAPTPLADDPTFVALAVALACEDAPNVQDAPPRAVAAPGVAGPELELVATVRARELSFDEVPQLRAALARRPLLHTTWKTERVNLPVRPEAGVPYHDVAVRLTISSTIDELAHLLAQAKRASRGIHLEYDAAAAPASAPAAGPAPAPAPAAPAAAPAAKR